MEINQKIVDALTWRRAIRAFDPTKKLSNENLTTILTAANLTPSSYGLEPWKFIVVTDPEVRTKLRAAGYDQAQITEASHLIIITQRTDADTLVTELLTRTAHSQNKNVDELAGFKAMLEGAMTRFGSEEACNNWLARQTYIALGTMMETASLLGIDNGPMEGFNSTQVNEILGLTEKNLSSVTMLTLGYRVEESNLPPKVRREFTDTVEFVQA